MTGKNDMKKVKSMSEPEALQEAKNTPQGRNPYYHVIGKLGGQSVRDKYADFGSEPAGK